MPKSTSIIRSGHLVSRFWSCSHSVGISSFISTIFFPFSGGGQNQCFPIFSYFGPEARKPLASKRAGPESYCNVFFAVSVRAGTHPGERHSHLDIILRSGPPTTGLRKPKSEKGLQRVLGRMRKKEDCWEQCWEDGFIRKKHRNGTVSSNPPSNPPSNPLFPGSLPSTLFELGFLSPIAGGPDLKYKHTGYPTYSNCHEHTSQWIRKSSNRVTVVETQVDKDGTPRRVNVTQLLSIH